MQACAHLSDLVESAGVLLAHGHDEAPVAVSALLARIADINDVVSSILDGAEVSAKMREVVGDRFARTTG
jgi:hypothetical protein